jgi:hypothetical protein
VRGGIRVSDEVRLRAVTSRRPTYDIAVARHEDGLLDALLSHRRHVGQRILGRRLRDVSRVAVAADEGELLVECLVAVLHADVGDVRLRGTGMSAALCSFEAAGGSQPDLVDVVALDAGVVPAVANPVALDLHLPARLVDRVAGELAHIGRRKLVDLGGARVLLEQRLLGEVELRIGA